MIMYILLVLVLLIPFICGLLDVKEFYDEKKVFSWKIIRAFFVTSGIISLVAVVLGVVLTILMAVIGSTVPGSKQVTVFDETYKIAPGSKLDTTSGLKFVAIYPDGHIEPKDISYSKLKIDSLNATEVRVEKVEHFHEFFYPMVANTRHVITIK